MSDESILSLPPVPADTRIHYGSDSSQVGDLFLPKSKGAHPVLMNIHGGYWRAKYDLSYASHFCRALADAGIAVWGIEYRRVGNPGGGWPGTFEDILSAWSALPRLASQHNLNLKRTIVCGHSAGAQLALALASRSAGQPLKPRAAISLAGVLDLQRAYDLHLSNDAVVEFLGGAPKQRPEHYAEADPMRLTIGVPQALFHGVPDDDVPVAISHDYAKAKYKANEDVSYHESATSGHFEWMDPATQEFHAVKDKAAALLAS